MLCQRLAGITSRIRPEIPWQNPQPGARRWHFLDHPADPSVPERWAGKSRRTTRSTSSHVTLGTGCSAMIDRKSA